MNINYISLNSPLSIIDLFIDNELEQVNSALNMQQFNAHIINSMRFYVHKIQ